MSNLSAVLTNSPLDTGVGENVTMPVGGVALNDPSVLLRGIDNVESCAVQLKHSRVKVGGF